MKTKFLALTIFTLLLVFACQTDSIDEFDSNSIDIDLDAREAGKRTNNSTDGEKIITSEYLDRINVQLAKQGLDYRVLMAEYITSSDSDEAGLTVFAKDVGNKQLNADFVPFDPRRTWSGPVDGDNDNITYAIDQTTDATPLLGGLTGAETDAAIEKATSTWQNANCSNLDLTRNDDFGIDIGVVAYSAGLGGSPFVFADVQHAGFNLFLGDGVLGVTFTYIWIDGGGETDIDNNGKLDTAFREIYYSVAFSWADDGSTNFDVESIALHELGHGLSQGHFGTVAVVQIGTPKARWNISPRAVMNAIYISPHRELDGSDNGGHCSIWAQWPMN